MLFLTFAFSFNLIRFTFLVILKISKYIYTTIAIYKEIYRALTHYLPSEENNTKDVIGEIIARNKNDVTYEMAQLTVTNIIKKDQQSGSQHLNVEKFIPTLDSLRTVLRFVWSTATGQEQMTEQTEHTVQKNNLILSKNATVMTACVESLGVLYYMFSLEPAYLELFSKEGIWNQFVIDLILFCPEKSVREAALIQFTQILSKCGTNITFQHSCLRSMFDHLKNSVPEHYEKSEEFFALTCKLLQNPDLIHLDFLVEFVDYEINLLSNVRTTLGINGLIEEIQLKGHLNILRQLLQLLPTEIALKVAQTRITSSRNFVEMLLFDFIFPFSRAIALQKRRRSNDRSEVGFYDRRGGNSFVSSRSNFEESNISLVNSSSNCRSDEHLDELNADDADVNAVCTTSSTLTAVYDLLIALSYNCLNNLKFVCDSLHELLYQEVEYSPTVWEFLHSVGPRPLKGFVGLKNAGATCYMNSVLQQVSSH
jgi:ubiquitin carboxyl-terminal hydrolase 9/24